MRTDATRVLVVEDEPADALLVQRSLRADPGIGRRFDVQCAGTLGEALERLGCDPVDVLLLDLNLPDSDGSDTVVRLRNRNQHVPLVVFTGDRDPALSARSLEAGADEYLLKDDLHDGLLLRTIQHAIERRVLRLRIELAAGSSSPSAERALRHELKNLHTCILGNAKLLRDELAGDARDFLQSRAEALIDAARLAGDRVQQLFKEGTSGPPTPLDLSALVRRAEPLLRAATPPRVTLCLELAEEPTRVAVREERLRSALLELVVNAVDAIGEKGRIRVRTGKTWVEGSRLPVASAPRGLAAGPHAWLEVRDTGSGFHPDDLPYLMQRGSTTKGADRGYGLWDLREILAEHHAALVVRSRLGIGSTFRILIPSPGGETARVGGPDARSLHQTEA
jgi:signal transduction histidine kinase